MGLLGATVLGLILLFNKTLVKADCLSVAQHDQCHEYDDVCYIAQKAKFNCPEGQHYHCAWSPDLEKFIEKCAAAVICGEGKEPKIYVSDQSGQPKTEIRCEWCRDSMRYNPQSNTMSYEISECPRRKSDCYPDSNKVVCDYEHESDKYTKNVRCRCDVKNGYRIARQYDENETACTYDDAFSCVAASCSGDVLIQGYQCATKCPPGEERSDEKSDKCIPVSTHATPTTSTAKLPPLSEKVTTALPPVTTVTTVTTTSTPKPTSTQVPIITPDSQTGSLSKGWIFSIAILCGTCVVVVGIIGIIVAVVCCKRKCKKNEDDPERLEEGIIGIIVAVVCCKRKCKKNEDDPERLEEVPLNPVNGSTSQDQSGGSPGGGGGSTNGTHVPAETRYETHNYYGPVYNAKKMTINKCPEQDNDQLEVEMKPLMSKEGLVNSQKPMSAVSHHSNNSSRTSLSKREENENQNDGPSEDLKDSEKHQKGSKGATYLERRLSQSAFDVTVGKDISVKTDGVSEGRPRSSSLSLKVFILHHKNLDKDILTTMMEYSIDKCTPWLLEHMSPEELCREFIKRQLFQYINIRDTSEESKTTKRNDSIINVVRRSGWVRYLSFKHCLKDTKQQNCAEKLQEKEQNFVKGLIAFVMDKCKDIPKEMDTSLPNQAEEGTRIADEVITKVEDEDMYRQLKDNLKSSKQLQSLKELEKWEKCYIEDPTKWPGNEELAGETHVEDDYVDSTEEANRDQASDESLLQDEEQTNETEDHQGQSNEQEEDDYVDGTEEANRDLASDESILKYEEQTNETAERQGQSNEQAEQRAQELLEQLRNTPEDDLEQLQKISEDAEVIMTDQYPHSDLGNSTPLTSPIDYTCCPEGFQAYRTSGKLNSCLYQSISILLFRHENLHKRLRLLAALYAVKHLEEIIKEIIGRLKDESKEYTINYFSSMMKKKFDESRDKEELIEQCVKTIVKETAMLGEDSCLMNVLFLARALGRSIKSNFPIPEYDILDTSVEGDNDPLNIMWVNMQNDTGKPPDHIVPLGKLE